jgi:ubiquinone/menaquinone biosynthesis C-methylase UbiE
MTLKDVQKTYEVYGKEDPLYAVLSRKDAKDNKWDADEFFASGREEIADAMNHLTKLGLEVNKGRAMDFGCGVGRLTQALCQEFSEAVGVDISYSMIESAEKHNRFRGRCEYRVNTTDDLEQLDDASFDFVYSNISLQHSPPEASSKYIAEFFRILQPGGVALFQIPSGPRHEPGSLDAKIYSIKRGPLRRFWKRIRGMPPVEIHYVNQSLVEEIIEASGGRLIDATQKGSVRGSRVSMLYCAVRE